MTRKTNVDKVRWQMIDRIVELDPLTEHHLNAGIKETKELLFG